MRPAEIQRGRGRLQLRSSSLAGSLPTRLTGPCRYAPLPPAAWLPFSWRRRPAQPPPQLPAAWPRPSSWLPPRAAFPATEGDGRQGKGCEQSTHRLAAAFLPRLPSSRCRSCRRVTTIHRRTHSASAARCLPAAGSPLSSFLPCTTVAGSKACGPQLPALHCRPLPPRPSPAPPALCPALPWGCCADPNTRPPAAMQQREFVYRGLLAIRLATAPGRSSMQAWQAAAPRAFIAHLSRTCFFSAATWLDFLASALRDRASATFSETPPNLPMLPPAEQKKAAHGGRQLKREHRRERRQRRSAAAAAVLGVEQSDRHRACVTSNNVLKCTTRTKRGKEEAESAGALISGRSCLCINSQRLPGF